MAEKLEVRDFKRKILAKAYRMIGYKSKPMATAKNALMYSGTLGSAPTVVFYGNPIYHLTGLAAAALSRAIDLHSTNIAVKEMDQRFHEYGFGSYFSEQSIITPHHPKHLKENLFTKINLSNLFREYLPLGLGVAAPPSAYGYLTALPAIYRNNTQIAKEIKLAKEIGRMVGEKIEKGADRSEIENAIMSYGKDRIPSRKEIRERKIIERQRRTSRLEEITRLSFFAVLFSILFLSLNNFRITGNIIGSNFFYSTNFLLIIFLLALSIVLINQSLNKKIRTLYKGFENAAAPYDMQKDEMQEYSNNLITLLSREEGLHIPKDDFPELLINPDEETAYIGRDNQIELHSESELLDWDTMSEEIFHFFRKKLKPAGEKDEILTDEFFGFLGTRCAYQLALKKGVAHDFFEYGKPDYRKAMGTKHMANENLKKLRQELKELTELYKNERNPLKKEEIYKNGAGKTNERRDIIEHFRGYEAAKRVDLGKIHNWEKLLSLPSKEVRRRFFTPK